MNLKENNYISYSDVQEIWRKIASAQKGYQHIIPNELHLRKYMCLYICASQYCVPGRNHIFLVGRGYVFFLNKKLCRNLLFRKKYIGLIDAKNIFDHMW